MSPYQVHNELLILYYSDQVFGWCDAWHRRTLEAGVRNQQRGVTWQQKCLMTSSTASTAMYQVGLWLLVSSLKCDTWNTFDAVIRTSSSHGRKQQQNFDGGSLDKAVSFTFHGKVLAKQRSSTLSAVWNFFWQFLTIFSFFGIKCHAVWTLLWPMTKPKSVLFRGLCDPWLNTWSE